MAKALLTGVTKVAGREPASPNMTITGKFLAVEGSTGTTFTIFNSDDYKIVQTTESISDIEYNGALLVTASEIKGNVLKGIKQNSTMLISSEIPMNIEDNTSETHVVANTTAGDVFIRCVETYSTISAAFNGATGWADYDDTQYTSGSPFSIVGNTDYLLPNDGGSGVTSQTPNDLNALATIVASGAGYDTLKINGRNGDAIIYTIDLKCVPTNAGTTYIEFWIDIGGAVGELYRRIVSFPKGNGIVRPITLTTLAYTLNTWEANGGSIYVRANGSADLYDIRTIIAPIHRSAL